jgi:nucleotide-binding universal stress UspA family protein
MADNGLSRILVALDGSSHSQYALQQAINLCKCTGAELIALHVAVPTIPLSVFERDVADIKHAEDAARAFGEKVLQEAEAEAKEKVNFKSELIFGDPTDTIRERAKELGVDVIVIGNRGLGGIDQFVLGSVSMAVVENAHCSVFVVRKEED